MMMIKVGIVMSNCQGNTQYSQNYIVEEDLVCQGSSDLP